MRNNRMDISAWVLGATGEAKRKQGVVAVERASDGVYNLRFPADKPVRAEAYHLSVTILNKDTFRSAQLADVGGATIQVRIFDDAAMPADADFLFGAERV
ncbi:MAG: hypothetical protein IPG45_33665 [Deltaproteobacteria bacterium]|nr:hypothetical protein [Deltaproteobacteria bacterium]